MDRLRAMIERVGSFLRRNREDAELDEELRHHLDMEIQANLRAGMAPREARRKAYIALGGTDWTTERVRDERWGRPLEDLARDLRFGARNLRKRPAFTLAALLTLSLGIGMTTTMFVLVDAVLLRPLSGSNTRGMVYLELESDDHSMTMSPTPELLRRLRDHSSAFSRVEAYATEDVDLLIDGEPVRATGATASVGFFDFLGVTPALGRSFRPGDGMGGGSPVAVLSHPLWMERFGGSREALGRTLHIGESVYEVVGVLPLDFRLDTRVEPMVWIAESDAGGLMAEEVPVEGALARLADGMTVEAAQAELDAIVRNNPLSSLADQQWSARVRTPGSLIDPSLKRALLVLQAAAGLVLLIGCGNLVNLLLAQGETRSRELALRASLGARRGRLARQLLSESLLLGVLGWLGGVLLATWSLRILPLFVPQGFAGFAAHGGAFLFATAIALTSVLLVGLLPARRGSARELVETIKGNPAGPAGSLGHLGLRKVLVAAEVALTVVLLVGAGLLTKSFAGLTAMDVGFDSRNLLHAYVELPEDRYETGETRLAFFDALTDHLNRSLPPHMGEATLASGLVEHLGARFVDLTPDGEGSEEQAPALVLLWEVAPDFFRVVGVPIVEGRAFAPTDGRAGEPGVIITEQVARRRFPGLSAVGRQISIGGDPHRVIGVSGPIRLPSLAQSRVEDLQVFFPLRPNVVGGMAILTRVQGELAPVVDIIRGAVHDLDPGLPVQEIALVDDQLADSLAEQRSNMLLMVLFGATALILGAVGIYGVVAYSVTRRTREMGIRLALGASSGEVVRRIVRGGMATVGVGAAVGSGGALALGAAFTDLLHEVEPRDPAIFLLVLAVTGVVSLLATWLPARRATGAGPIESLRGE